MTPNSICSRGSQIFFTSTHLFGKLTYPPTRGCGYFTVNRTEELCTVDFPTVRFFPILVSFLSFSDLKKIFKRKNF